METSPLPRAANFWPMRGAQGLWAERDIYCATSAVAWGLRFSGLIRRTFPFSRLLQYTRECGGPTLTRILTDLLWECSIQLQMPWRAQVREYDWLSYTWPIDPETTSLVITFWLSREGNEFSCVYKIQTELQNGLDFINCRCNVLTSCQVVTFAFTFLLWMVLYRPRIS
jgi:hypothetical protein